MDYRTRRQFLAFLVVVVILAGLGFSLFYRYSPASTCTDNKQNQSEEAVDCGGPHCAPCAIRHADPLTVVWTRIAPARPAMYDVVAEIRNPNSLIAARSFDYDFRLFDTAGTQMAEKSGSSFAYSGETLHVAEFGLAAPRPVDNNRTNLVISNVDWIAIDATGPDLFAGNRNYSVEKLGSAPPTSVLTASVANRTIFDVSNVTVTALILDPAGNLVGVNRTLLNSLAGGGETNVRWTWPVKLKEPIGSILIEPRSPMFLTSNP